MANEVKLHSIKKNETALKVVIYVVSIFFSIMTLFPFVMLICNSYKNTYEVQASTLSLYSKDPLKNLAFNWKQITSKDAFHPGVGFRNSFIVATLSTVLNVYFSCLTAYAITAYEWKLREGFNAMIMAVMMIPGTVTMIGFFQMAYKIGLVNKLSALILPSIAAPMVVFFMRQYLQASLSMEIVQSARIDGAGEFRIFNQIVIPLMKPAIATQAIFAYVGSWNNLLSPMILLTDKSKKTLPVMVSLLNGDIYKKEYGAIYLGLLITVLPLIVVYAFLSKYIVEGVALGGVKS